MEVYLQIICVGCITFILGFILGIMAERKITRILNKPDEDELDEDEYYDHSKELPFE